MLLCVRHFQVDYWITSGEPSPFAMVDTTVLHAFMTKFASLRGDPVATLSTTDQLALIDHEVRPDCKLITGNRLGGTGFAM